MNPKLFIFKFPSLDPISRIPILLILLFFFSRSTLSGFTYINFNYVNFKRNSRFAKNQKIEREQFSLIIIPPRLLQVQTSYLTRE